MPGETSGMPLPIGYSQQTLQDYYKSLINPIEMDTASQRGSARTDAAARGLEGTATETGGVAAADYFGGMRKDAALGGLAMNMSGLANQDALIKEQQGWQSGESEKDRALKLQLAQMGYDFEGNMAATQNRYGYQAGIAGLGSSILGGAASTGMLKYAGAFA